MVAAATELTVAAGEAPRRIQLLPMGQINLIDGRGPYLLADRAHAERVVAATRTRLGNRDFPYDYDHQIEFGVKSRKGGTAPASGWIKPEAITADDDGIWAEVDWTPAAAAQIAAREYRYTSPVFLADGAKRVTRLTSAALTNTPAIDLPAIAASEEDGMIDPKKIAAALGLGEDATEDGITAAIAALKTTSAIAAAAIAAAGAAEDADGETVIAALRGKPDPKKFVPIETVTATTERLAVLETERHERIVDGQIAAGKLAPAQREWGLSLIAANEESFNTWAKTAPTVLKPGLSVVGDPPAGKPTALTEEQIAACEMTGTSKEEFLATLVKEAA